MDLPTNTAQLAGIVERALRNDNDVAGPNDAELTRLSGLVAHHGARYTLAHGVTVFGVSNSRKLARAQRRIYARVQADMAGSVIGTFLLSSMISYAVRKLLEWIFQAAENREALVAIAAPLPVWGNDDDAAILKLGTPEEPEPAVQ